MDGKMMYARHTDGVQSRELACTDDGYLVIAQGGDVLTQVVVTASITDNTPTTLYTPATDRVLHVTDLIVSYVGQVGSTDLLVEMYFGGQWNTIAVVHALKGDDGNFAHSFVLHPNTDTGDGAQAMLRVTGSAATVEFEITVIGFLEDVS